jgi:hypothetical protein
MTRFARLSAVIALVCASLWLASSDTLVRAQSASEPQQRQLLMINEIQLKPETAPEWMELQKSTLDTQKKVATRGREVWASGPGGDPYLRAVVTPIASLAQFDNPNPFIKAMGEQGFAEYSAKNRKLVASAHSTIVVTRPDLGFGTRPTTAPKLALLSMVHAASGRGPELEAFLKSDVVPALKKGGVTYYSVVQVVFGDDVNKYMTLMLVNDFAEIAKGSPLERALGAEGMTKLTQKAGPLMTRLERRIIRYLPDLSFGPSTSTSN